MAFYKKGQIIPRRIVRCKNRETQHRCVFGCDVEIIGRNIIAISSVDIILLNLRPIAKSNRKNLIYNIPHINNISVYGLKDGSNTIIRSNHGEPK